MFIPFNIILRPLIYHNYKQRYKSAVYGYRNHPDEWYWADLIAIRFGYYVGQYKP